MADSKMWRGLKPNKAKKVFELNPSVLEATKEFGENDFRMLVKATHEVFSKWENIGTCLSIPAQTMDDLGHKWRRNAVRGMISILDEWVKRNYGVEALHPCWHSLVYVVADAIGGGNPAAASNIARNWKEYEKDPFFYYPKAKEADSSPLDIQQKTQIAADLCRDFLHKVKAHWFEIGVLLGVPISELDELEKKDVNHMIKVIERWIDLSMDSDFDYLPPPTLQVLSDAVANKMGGNNAGLAIKLRGVKSLSQTSPPGSANPGSPPSSVHPASPPGPVNPLSPPGLASPGSVNPASPPDSAHINAVPHQQHQSGQQPQNQPGVPQEFSDSMSSDQLYSWLLSMNLPENDCNIIKDKGITGIAFKFLPETEWRKYGISNVDLLLHFQQKVSPGFAQNTSSNETTHMDTSGSKVSSGASKFPVERPQPVNHCDKYWQYIKHFNIGDQCWKLEAVVSDNEIVWLAKDLLTWETELPALLNLTPTNISDIHSGISDRDPLLKRKRALQIWKSKNRLNATFESLLDICLRGGDSKTAENICVYLRDQSPEEAHLQAQTSFPQFCRPSTNNQQPRASNGQPPTNNGQQYQQPLAPSHLPGPSPNSEQMYQQPTGPYQQPPQYGGQPTGQFYPGQQPPPMHYQQTNPPPRYQQGVPGAMQGPPRQQQNRPPLNAGYTPHQQTYQQPIGQQPPSNTGQLNQQHPQNTGGGTPTMIELLKFPSADGTKVNLAVEIGVDSSTFGILLLQDDSGARVSAIEHECRGNAEKMNKKIFTLWLSGKGKQPITWSTLVDVLRDADLNRLAAIIEAAKLLI